MARRNWSGGWRVCAVLGALLLPASCQDDAGPGLGEQAERVAEAVCEGAFSCDCDNASTDNYASKSACIEGLTEVLVERATDDVGLSFDAACADAVSEALAVFACESPDQAQVSAALFGADARLAGCRLFVGTAGEGESCERLDGGLGDSCGPDLVCEAGLCVGHGDNALEAGCASDDECVYGLRCRQDAEDMSLRCLPLPGPDEACSMSGDCGPDAYCNSAMSCVALPTSGQSCALSPSAGGLVCVPGSACVNGVCEPGALQGEPCGATCAAGLTCESGFCRTRDAAVCRYEVDAL